jgi:hypothetical protein
MAAREAVTGRKPTDDYGGVTESIMGAMFVCRRATSKLNLIACMPEHYMKGDAVGQVRSVSGPS